MNGQNYRNKIHIELLRIICIFLAIFNHTGQKGFFYFSVAKESRLYWLYMFISIACKVAVPVFFMISGALLLGKKESFRDLYKKRVIKYVLILIVVSLFSQIYWDVHYGTEISLIEIGKFLKIIYSGEAALALWYLYSYIGALIMLPLLRKLVSVMESKDYIYLACCSLIFSGIIPIIQFIFSKGTIHLNSHVSVTLFTSTNIVYMLMGYYIENVLDKKYYNKTIAIKLITFSVVCIMICCLMTQYKANITGELTEEFYNSLILVPTVSCYYCCKWLFMNYKLNAKTYRIIQFIGRTTFGVYLVEGILRDRMLFVYYNLNKYLPSIPACFLYVLVTLSVGVIIIAVLRQIPLLRKFI